MKKNKKYYFLNIFQILKEFLIYYNMNQRPCKFYIKGNCRDGDNCKFQHVNDVCKYFFLRDSCKKGDECKFKHIASIRKKNTETFQPNHTPSDMRVLVGDGKTETYNEDITSQDVVVIPDLFCAKDDLSFYNKILEEIKQENVWKLWHGDTHLIADDKTDWKKDCPTFNKVLEKIGKYFKMDIKATRLNWYRDSSEWKPYHHDAAAVKADKAKTQNFTVSVSFGLQRDVSFEHAKNRARVTIPLPNGSTYTFSNVVNKVWRHGILQVPKEKQIDQGRISIIAWGKVDY